MSELPAHDREALAAIWKAAASLEASQIPVLRNYAKHVLVETSTVFDQLMLPAPDIAASDD